MRAYLAQRDGDRALVDDAAVWDLPRVRASLPSSLAGPLRDMRADQPRFLAALDGLPRTLCHLDLHPANLFAVGGETVAIDWSFVGVGALGEDAGNLVADAVLDFHVRPEHLDELLETVSTGYVEGLADAGWRGSPELVRLGMSATMAAKYAWIGPAVLRAAAEEKEMLNRRPFDDAVQWWAPTVEFLLRQTSRARDLLRRANG
jgi:thiamine kinase-like enzyme